MKILGLVLALLVSSSAAGNYEVSVTRLDGTTQRGTLQSWQERELRIQAAEREFVLKADDLIQLRFDAAETDPQNESRELSPHLTLVDGSVLPIREFRTTAGGNCVLQLRQSGSPAQQSLELPTKQIASVLLKRLDGPAIEQWNQIQKLQAPGDVLVILKRQGESLDYVEGVVGNVDKRVSFELDGEAVRIDQDKVAGIIYYRGADRPTDEASFVVHGASSMRVLATAAELRDDHLHMTALAGVELDWPLADLRLADFSAGKLLYLSDLEIASQQWTPMVGLPESAILAAKFGAPRLDQSARGGELTLVVAEPQDAAGQRTKAFDKGLALRSRTELLYRLPDGFTQFRAIAGIDPELRSTGHVRLSIFGDDRVLFEGTIAGQKSATPIEFDLAGARRLKILVDYGENLDSGDWLNLCDARLIK